MLLHTEGWVEDHAILNSLSFCKKGQGIAGLGYFGRGNTLVATHSSKLQDRNTIQEGVNAPPTKSNAEKPS